MIVCASSAPGERPLLKAMPTKNGARKEKEMDGLRPEYNISKLTGAVQGKYFREATASTTLVVLEPDVAEAFPNAPSS